MTHQSPLFLQPHFQERIWGGTMLNERFGYEIPSETTGECWAISAHPHGQSTVKNGPFKGLMLTELWEQHRELFGNHAGEKFPLLTKILDCQKDLSVQVHPDDQYAREHENGELGKTECWYVIDCKPDAEIIYGHNARTKEELIEMVNQSKWGELLRKIKIKPGDFFYVPSGTIHALGAGTLVLETQQNSDTTYRVYDYDRLSADGQKRALHIEQSIEVAKVPHIDQTRSPIITVSEGTTITTFIKEKYFSVYKWEVVSNTSFRQNETFMLASVIRGMGDLVVNGSTYGINQGDHFILPSGIDEFRLNGELEVIVAHTN